MRGGMNLWFAALVSGGVAAIVCALLAPRVVRLAHRWGVLDRPGGRKEHAVPVPRLGGLAVVPAIACGILAVVASTGWLRRSDPVELATLLGATAVIFALGLVDDLRTLPAWVKLPIEVIVASVLVAVGSGFHVLGLPFMDRIELGLLGPILSVLWIVGVTNAINLIDGLDGLAGGVVAIIASSFLVYALMTANPLPVVVVGAMAGACSAFLFFNWSPARLFLGDCGSLTLGFLLATIGMRSTTKASTTVAILVPVLALGVPVLDTLLVASLRFLERPHSTFAARTLRVFRADRNHLHHLLRWCGLTRRGVVLTIYSLVLVFCLFSLLVAATRKPELGLPLLVIEVGVIVAARRLGLSRETASRSVSAPEPVGSLEPEPERAQRRASG